MLPAQEGPEAQYPSDAPHARANVSRSAVDGSFGVGAAVKFTVTTSGGTPKGDGQGRAGPEGWMNGGQRTCDIQPGDQVHMSKLLPG